MEVAICDAARPVYHLVALRPTNDEAFRAACEKALWRDVLVNLMLVQPEISGV